MRWQAAHEASLACFANCSRIVVAPRVSGSIAFTLPGGGGMVAPSNRSMKNTPRGTGDVVVPLAVTLSTLACVMSPPRSECGGSDTRRSSQPSTPGMP